MSEKQHVDPLEETRAESIRPGKLIAGAPIGGYELQHVLGEGGMGVVWCARDPLLDRAIAIKVLKSKDVAAAMRTRLLREAQAMAQIKHPNVLTVHRVGTESDRDYIVMELVDGGPLDHWLAFGPPHHEVMEALLAAGRGLAAAHAAGLVHRDFKPNNVLRSKDGRVLVTDFGLARGLGEDWNSPVGPTGSLDPDARVTPTSRDNVLDQALTKTGALIGTPAYMAPEQFTGAEPDPRTDQFAYCVTAWQALTGARPFHGRTLDELRQAANQGVSAVIAQLDKPMRAVLTRGLDPDPAKRWPDMATLLREIERAGKPPRPKWPFVAGGLVAVIAAVAIFVATRPAAAPPCPAFSDLWARADEGEARPWVHRLFYARFTEWGASYHQACSAPTAKTEARLACLRLVRDRIAITADLENRPATRAAHDPFTLLVPLEACTSKLAALPADRARLVTVLATDPTSPEIDAAAMQSGWAPARTFVAVAGGIEWIRRGELARGRELLERTIAAAEATDARLAAQARLGLLEASLRELAKPDTPGKPDVPHDELARALTYARGAVKAAGDEPILAGQLALLEAELLADQAERSKKTSIEEALDRALAARKAFDTAGDPRRSAQAAMRYAEIQQRRGDPAALGDAEFAARSAFDTLERSKLPVPVELEHQLGMIAFARGDLVTAHRWLDRSFAIEPPIAEGWVEGLVLGADDKPLMNAVVVAWTGELHGDSTRAVTDRRSLRGHLVETGPEGKFAIRVAPGSALLAEAPDGAARTLPIAIEPGTKNVKLQLAPTTELAGRLDLDGGNPDVYARFPVGSAAWVIHTPIDKSGGFRVTNLPPGTWQLGAIGRSGTGMRHARGVTLPVTEKPMPLVTSIAWVAGTSVDVVVRGRVSPDAKVWLGDAGALARLATRDDLEAWAVNTVEAASSSLEPIGSRYTEAGRPLYSAGARHAILVGDFKTAAACVAPAAERTSKVTCKVIEKGARAIAFDL